MNDNVLFDTSIIVYAYDESQGSKRKTCKQLLETVFDGSSPGTVSNQILAETFNVLTTQMFNSMNKDTAEQVVNDFIVSAPWNKINYNTETVKKAMITSKLFGAPFWDSLIAETMKENGVDTIVTENEKDFRKIPGIKVVNPFK